MKLNVAVEEVTLSNTTNTGEFRIRNSAKAFKILSDGLYANKKKAIIRELSCNAIDSHSAAGKLDVPFEVHLPTVLEPWFSVRDFGLGLDDDQVMNIYTTYFESTKTDSNQFIGALGLGSKSPFSYTQNFTVTAIKNGVQRIYSAYINAAGVPSVTKMSEDPTTEPNGVEVKFSVTERWDYDSFEHEAFEVFKWFKHKPKITGAKLELSDPKFVDKNIVPGVHSWDRYECMAVMGNIAYPLSSIPEPRKTLGELAGLLECGLVLEFEIGELDFAASREELSYIPSTIDSIKKKLEEVNKNLAKYIASQADLITCEWARAEYLYGKSQERLYNAAVKKYVADTKFELYDSSNYHGRKEFILKDEDLAKLEIDISSFSASTYNGCYKNGKSRRYSNATSKYEESWDIPVSLSTVLVLNDLKIGCNTRARYHYGKAKPPASNITVFCIQYNGKGDDSDRDRAFNALRKKLHNPPTVIKASELEKQEKLKASVKQGILTMGVSKDYYGRIEGASWSAVSSDFENDDSQTYYYVPMSNYTAYDTENKEIDMHSIKKAMAGCGIPDIEGFTIYGVRKSVIEEIKKLPNWKYFGDKLSELVSNIDEKKVEESIFAGMFDGYRDNVYTSRSIAKLAGKDSPYSVFVEKLPKKTTTGSTNRDTQLQMLNHISTLCDMFGKTLAIKDIQAKAVKEKEAIAERYPLLGYIYNAPEKQIAEYIKLVDKLEKTND